MPEQTPLVKLWNQGQNLLEDSHAGGTGEPVFLHDSSQAGLGLEVLKPLQAHPAALPQFFVIVHKGCQEGPRLDESRGIPSALDRVPVRERRLRRMVANA